MVTMNAVYDAYLLWIICAECQYACSYCIGAKGRKYAPGPEGKTIDVNPLLASLDRLGVTCRIGFTGGEPMMVNNLVEIVTALTLKHYVGMNTNLTLPNAKHFVEKINPERITQLTCSLHIDELERGGGRPQGSPLLRDIFIENATLARDRGFHMMVLQVAHPALFSRHEEIKRLFSERKIPFTFSSFYGEYQGKKYPDAYTPEEIRDFEIPLDRVNIHKPKNPCNAGFNTAVIVNNGNVLPCHHSTSVMGNIYTPEGFTFNKDMMKCEFKTCVCASHVLDPGLYKKALEALKV